MAVLNLKSSAGMSPAPRSLSFMDGSSYDPNTGEQINGPSSNPKVGLPTLTKTNTSAPPASVAPPNAAPTVANTSQDPITKFNLGLYDLLQKAQGMDSSKLLNERNRLAIAQTSNSQAPAADLNLGGLTPDAALNARQNASNLYNPEIKNLTDRVQASAQAVSQFKDAIDAATKYGEDYAKSVKPTEEDVAAVQNMLAAGYNPGETVLNAVKGQIDWKAVAAADKSRKAITSGGGGSTVSERTATAKGEAVSKISAAFNDRGVDHFINPDLYREMRDNWGKQFGSVAEFYKEFPIYKYISSDNQVGDLSPDDSGLIG